MTATPTSVPVTRLSRLQSRPLWALLTAVFADAEGGSARATLFLERNKPFAGKVSAYLHRLNKRRCGNAACLCQPAFDDGAALKALLEAALGGTQEAAAAAVSDLEQRIQAAAERLKVRYTCEACKAYHRRTRSISPRKAHHPSDESGG